jgi:hypothetical protein
VTKPKRIKSTDRVGQVFGRLTINRVYRENGRPMCECSCSCGRSLFSRIDALQSGATVSCGCYIKELASKIHSTHRMQDTGAYSSWESMKQRCLNVNHKHYDRYKDVPICDKWLKFEGFYEDMGDRPEYCTLDRTDNSGGYCKENCRWSTASYQAKNQKKRNAKTTLSPYKGVGRDLRQKTGKVWFFSVTKNYKTLRVCCHNELEAAASFDYCSKLLYSEHIELNNVDYFLSESEKSRLKDMVNNKFKENTNA